MAKYAGKAIIRWDGNVLATENGATFNPGGVNRPSERHGGKTYYREEEVAPSIECSILLDKDADVIALSNITSATIEFETDMGRTYILRGAFTSDPVVEDTSTGKAPLKMEADSADRI